MKLAHQIEPWTGRIDGWLANNIPGVTRHDIRTGVDAWTIFHRAGLTADAYRDGDTCDAHIQTALTKIFPAAAFNDKCRY